MLIKQTSSNPYGFWRLLFRSFIPSTTSMIVSSVISLLFIGTNLLFISLDTGALLPGVFGDQGDQWTNAYANAIVHPLQSVSQSNTLNTFLVALVWGTIGWTIYAITAIVVATVRDVRGNQDAIYLPDETHIVHHPLRRLLIMRLLWRLCIVVTAIVVMIAMMPLFARMSAWSQDLALASHLSEALKMSGQLFLGWMATQYVAVVLLRLFLFRTRVYGEIVD